MLENYRFNWLRFVGLEIVTMSFFLLILLLLGRDVPEERMGFLDSVYDFFFFVLLIGNTLVSFDRTDARHS